MAELDEKLVKCFAAVFPRLRDDEIRNATADSVPEWDSLAALTLVAVVEEQFAIEIDDLDLSELGSFEALHDYLNDRAHI